MTRTLILCLLFSSTSIVYSQVKSLDKVFCQTVALSSVVLQEVDKGGTPNPFDCENTSVLVVGKNLEGKIIKIEINPNEFHWCPAEMFKNSDDKSRASGAVTVLYDNPGNYDVTVSRFNQVIQFKNVTVEPSEKGGCHAKMVKLEVMFEDINKVKK